MLRNSHRKHGFAREHSLSIASIGILILWLCLYSISDPSTHIGSFFGNAIADWSGVVVTVIATKYLYEKGSVESRPCPPDRLPNPVFEWLREHSLTFFSWSRESAGRRSTRRWMPTLDGAKSSAMSFRNGRKFSASCC
jgi:hypothetical protein